MLMRPIKNLKEHIESRIVKDSYGCHLWSGWLTPSGYGCISIVGKAKRVHRVYWQLLNGPIPEGLCICHHCDVRNCINPKHLFLGTYADNRKDCVKKGRHYKARERELRIVCKRGHPYNKKNTLYSIENGIKRSRCRECGRAAGRKHYKKKKANG